VRSARRFSAGIRSRCGIDIRPSPRLCRRCRQSMRASVPQMRRSRSPSRLEEKAKLLFVAQGIACGTAPTVRLLPMTDTDPNIRLKDAKQYDRWPT
jgi:hypothetical protein